MCWFTGITSHKPDALKQMSIPLKTRAKDNEYFYYDENYSLYHAHLKISDIDKDTSQPYTTSRSIVSLVWEIYNTEFLQSILEENIALSEVKLISKLYEKFGRGFIEKLNGEFAISIYDKITKELHLYRDRYGTKTLYYTQKQWVLYFSSELWSLVDWESKLGKYNIYNHIIFGFGIAPHTLIEWVYSIPPWNTLTYNKEGVSRSQILPYTPTSNANSNFLDALEQAVKKRIPKHQDTIFLSLSWWLDSNIIAYFLKKHFHWKIVAYSFVSSKNKEDINIAQNNAQTLWIEHHILKTQDAAKNSMKHHEWLVTLPDLYDIIRKRLPQYKDVKVEFWGDGKEELFWINSNFNALQIQEKYEYIKKKKGIPSQKITKSFLNKHMLDYNLQMIDKMTLRNALERRMPFLDYELIKFKDYARFNHDMQDFLCENNLQYSSKKYAYSDGISFSYIQKEKEILQNAKSLLELLKSKYI